MYWILLIFMAIGLFYPAVGFIALTCMIGPILLSWLRGRYWCGHICPRGNFYDRVIARISPHRPVPQWLRGIAVRNFMVGLIFMVFGVQMYGAWGDAGAMGGVFVQIILLTTLVGIALGALYRPRTWCMICPMGTLSAWVAPRQRAAGKAYFQTVLVHDACVACKLCAKACPMQLSPYEGKGTAGGYVHADCLKCGRCAEKCPKQAIELQ